ncbi:MAG TPA: DoxX family protein [Candidatus Acidoferrum sp.]|nr:DoxX family protein [Candidatus Acidoferrum sp.]
MQQSIGKKYQMPAETAVSGWQSNPRRRIQTQRANGVRFMKRLLVTSNDGVLTVLRLVLGVVFFLHGAQKVLGWFGGFGFTGTMHTFTGVMHIPAPFAFLAIMAEFLGGIGLIVGLLARVAAFGIAVNMIVAVGMVHFANGPFMNWYGNQKGEGYEYHLLAIVIAVAIMVRGAGAFSVDHAITAKG